MKEHYGQLEVVPTQDKLRTSMAASDDTCQVICLGVGDSRD